MLSREQMEQTIRAGGSVMYKGKLITTIARIPSAAQMAETPEQKAAAASDIDAQIEALKKQKAALSGEDSATRSDKNSEKDSEKDSGNGDSDDSLEELMRHTRDELVDKAKEIKAEHPADATKAVIAQAILGKRKQSEPAE